MSSDASSLLLLLYDFLGAFVSTDYFDARQRRRSRRRRTWRDPADSIRGRQDARRLCRTYEAGGLDARRLGVRFVQRVPQRQLNLAFRAGQGEPLSLGRIDEQRDDADRHRLAIVGIPLDLR